VTTVRDLAFLRAKIPTPVKSLASVDPAIAEMSTLADREQLPELAARIEALFDEGIYDIRAISYYLWISWRTKGFPTLADVFATLTILATTNLASVGPAERREAHFAKRITWLSQKVNDLVQYHEAKRTAEWKAWQATTTPEDLEAVLAALRELDAALANGLTPARQALMVLAPRLQSLRDSFSRPVDAAVSGESAGVESVRQSAPSQPPLVRSGRAEVGVSAAYFDLVEKLEAFRTLIEKRELLKASIVADDLMHTIENFDPRTYFPEMFADFSEKLSRHIDELSPPWAERDTMSWKAMVQFYRVDLRRFVGR
jgi:hypothetical protein